MKAKKIYGMAKQSQNLLVLVDEARQFFNIGGDIYLIDGMPYMEDAEFLAYLDVPKHKRDEWDVVPKYMTGTHEAAVLGDMAGDDRELKPHPISITVGGKSYMAFLTEDGAVLWLDEEKLSPLAAAAWTFLLRHSETGESYIAVKEGLYLVALLRYELTPEVMPGEGLAERLLELAGGGPRTEDDENEEDVVGALKEMYGGGADGCQ